MDLMDYGERDELLAGIWDRYTGCRAYDRHYEKVDDLIVDDEADRSG